MLYKIAVISDFHVGANGRFKDTVTHGRSPQINADVADTFDDLVDSAGIQADLLLMPGDLSDRAEQEEFDLANKLLERIVQKLQIDERGIIGCPGNHDKMRGAFEGFEGIERLSNWSAEEERLLRSSYTNMANGIKVGTFSTPPKANDSLGGERYRIVTHRGIAVVSYNSTWLDWVPRKASGDDQEPDEIKFGYFHEEDASKIVEAVKALDRENDLNLIVVVLHHHPFVLDEPNAEQDISTLNGAEAFCKMCADIKANIVVHGHKHLSRLASQYFASRRTIPVLCAGSFCNRPEEYLQGRVLNQFHLIEIHDRKHPKHPGMGQIKSWSYCPSIGWVQSSEEFAPMAFITPFGNRIEQDELEAILRDAVDNANNTGKKGISWSDLCAEDCKRRYANSKAVEAAFDSLKEEGLIKWRHVDDDIKAAVVRE